MYSQDFDSQPKLDEKHTDIRIAHITRLIATIDAV